MANKNKIDKIDKEMIERFAWHKKPIGDQLHLMIPQEGVRHSVFPPEVKHNAIWDYIISPEGRHFFSLCAEGNFSQFAHMYEYMPDTGEMKLCFKLDDVAATYPRAIRPSKFHTSFSFMNDGRLIFNTHTTASPPNHPIWNPLAFYNHMWEGYHGANILIFDPATGKVEDLGMPIPRISIYGSVFEKTSNALYLGGYTKGNVYKFDPFSRRVKDYGQVTEMASFRLIVGPDGNVYFSSKSGDWLRVNTKLDRIEDMGVHFPVYADLPATVSHNQMLFGAFGPDGKLYISAAYGSELLRYDFNNNKIESIGEFAPPEFLALYPERKNRAGEVAVGLAFDEFGVLWYIYHAVNSSWLVSWDILKNGGPESRGLMGTPERRVGYVSEMHIKDGVIYAADSNHSYDPPAILSVDLKAMRTGAKASEPCRDPYHVMYYQDQIEKYGGDITADGERYYRNALENHDFYVPFMKDNPLVFSTSKHYLTKIWKQVPVEESSVYAVWYDEQDRVHVICGKTKRIEQLNDNEPSVKINNLNNLKGDGNLHRIVLREGCVISVDKDDMPIPEICRAEELFKNIKLPSQPGRQYLAKAAAYAELSGGRYLVGTLDGMLAVVSGDKVFSLGSCAPHGPVHQIVSTSGKKLAYGVAGDPYDLGTVFSYDDERGLIIYGRVYTNSPENIGGLGASCEPCCIAISRDDSKLVIGARDRLGCVYEYDLTSGLNLEFLD